jgi:hypothetical protein
VTPREHAADDLPQCWRTYWPDADVERMARDVQARVDEAIAAWRLTGAHPLPAATSARSSPRATSS